MRTIVWGNRQIEMTFQYDENSPIELASMRTETTCAYFPAAIPVVEILASGRGTGHSIGNRRLIQTSLGESLHFVSAGESQQQEGKRLKLIQENQGLCVRVLLDLFLPEGSSMVRSRLFVTNTGDNPLVLESLASWCSPLGSTYKDHAVGVDAWELGHCENEWLSEGRWQFQAIRDICPFINVGLTGRNPQGAYVVKSESSFSTGTDLPIGFLVSQEEPLAWVFQVEHNGPWRWEVGDNQEDGYFALSGPTYWDHSWSRVLNHNESFASVPVSVGLGEDFDDAVRVLTQYRKKAHAPEDHISTPEIVFNDYMNTINGDPTAEKLKSLIPAAAGIGADVFCIDCGWYDDTGYWWPSVGEWKPSLKRFPKGLGEVTELIRSCGMKPGLWLEPESVGIDSPVAQVLPDDAFFQHRGERVVEYQRLFLDYRNPAVVERMNRIVDGLIADYGIQYFKFDYNVMPGPGTDFLSDSAGDGLLGHNRAYRRWITDLELRHPGLILEHCSSGGMREDFANSSVFHLLSTSDQQDYRLYPVISASAPLAMLPIQAGNWAYPQKDMGREEFAFALTNTMPGHFFLSGFINEFNEEQQRTVSDAIDAYKRYIGPYLCDMVPFWPVGLPAWDDDLIVLGLDRQDQSLLTVWVRELDSLHTCGINIPLPRYRESEIEVIPVFPKDEGFSAWNPCWDRDTALLQLNPPRGIYAAKTFRILPKGDDSR